VVELTARLDRATGRRISLIICLAISLMLHNQLDDLACPICQLLSLEIVLMEALTARTVARGVYIVGITRGSLVQVSKGKKVLSQTLYIYLLDHSTRALR